MLSMTPKTLFQKKIQLPKYGEFRTIRRNIILLRYMVCLSLIAISGLSSGCGALKDLLSKDKEKPKADIKVPKMRMRFEKEPVAHMDAPPPPGYNPIWMSGIMPMDSSVGKDLFVSINRIDARVDSIKMYVQIMDSSGVYYRGGTQGKWKNMWCFMVDSTHKDTHIVKKMDVRELDAGNHEPLGLYVVADFSGSMGDDRADIVQNALRDFVDEKRQQDLMGLIKFDHYVQVPCRATNDTIRLKRALKAKGLEGYGGMTAINDALYKGIIETKAIPKRNKRAILMFSDGYDNWSHFSKDTIIQLARDANVPICAVDFGDSTSSNYLEDIARSTGGTYHHIWSTYEFDLVFRDIYQRLMNTYTITFAPNDVGWHKLKLRLCIPNKSLNAYAWTNNSPRTDSEHELLASLERKRAKMPKPLKLPSKMPENQIVYFDFNVAIPKEEEKAKIERTLAILKEYDGLKVKILGHTDFVGENDFNDRLSQDRCVSVQQALMAEGVSDGRIIIDSFGENKPAKTNATKEGRSKNRRVEIQFFHDSE